MSKISRNLVLCTKFLFFENFVKFILDEHRIYCYNLSRMTAWMCEVADTLGEVVPNTSCIREFVRSESVLDIDERRT